jgi:mono/diheme cytochrome c family protein
MRNIGRGTGRRVTPSGLVSVLAALALVHAVVHAVAARAEEPPAQAVEYKRALYLRYCSACHGNLGEGDGIVAPYMTPRPTNLLQIMKKHDNTFPFQGTMKQLDGTDNVRAHGAPEAPVWGEVWKEMPGMTPEHRAETRGKVVMITEYISSIQERGPIDLHYKLPGQK